MGAPKVKLPCVARARTGHNLFTWLVVSLMPWLLGVDSCFRFGASGLSDRQQPFRCLCSLLFATDPYRCTLQSAHQGHDMTYGPVSQYLKSCSKPDNSQLHPTFLSCVKEWIKQHNEDPSRVRIQSKRKLEEAFTTLEIEKATGTKFKKPKMTS